MRWPGAFPADLKKVRFPYYFRTGIKKGLGIYAKSLFCITLLVGGASFELATPAV
jgi:hypothetical protein